MSGGWSGVESGTDTVPVCVGYVVCSFLPTAWGARLILTAVRSQPCPSGFGRRLEARFARLPSSGRTIRTAFQQTQKGKAGALHPRPDLRIGPPAALSVGKLSPHVLVL